ncbi:MAG: hypothetical protein HYY84_03165 [Deltaproteobacteria bacterium]|nr:hypothetical protein [Deltaproteobacteria bacterium]
MRRSGLLLLLLLGLSFLVREAGAVKGFTPQLAIGASLNRTEWASGSQNESVFPTGTGLSLGGRLGYDVSFIPILSIDIGLTFEYHSAKVADSVKIGLQTVSLANATASLFWMGGGPSFRLNLKFVEPFAGIDFGYALFLAYDLPTVLTLSGSSYGFAISPYGGVYVRLFGWLGIGPIFRYTRFTATNSFGSEAGTGKFMTVALSVKFTLP